LGAGADELIEGFKEVVEEHAGKDWVSRVSFGEAFVLEEEVKCTFGDVKLASVVGVVH
jgi:hypothetical protein